MEWPGSTRAMKRARDTLARMPRERQGGGVALNEIWTLRRAVQTGLIAGFAALVIWPVHAVVQGAARPAFIAALAITALSGLSVLMIAAIDLATVRRDRRILPARIFDLALGLLLVVPASAALSTLLQ